MILEWIYITEEDGKEDNYEEKSASDKTEADNTIIHQPDGETGEKSENVQEQIGKESEAPAKISAPTPSQNRREFKRNQACMSEFYKEKNPAYLWLGDFLQNKGGG